MDGENRGVTADDERKVAESGDAVGDADRELLVEVFGTPLHNLKLIKRAQCVMHER